MFTTSEPFVLFIPRDKSCGVSLAYETLSMQMSNTLLLKEDFSRSGITDCIHINELADVNERLIIVAHPSMSRRGILSYDGDIINYNWFDNGICSFKYVFGYICEGYKIFSNNNWSQTFYKWASFEKKVYYVFNDRHLEKKFSKMFIGIARALKRIEDKDDFKNTVMQSLEASFIDFSKRLDEEKGDQLIFLLYGNIFTNIKFKQ